MGYTSDAVKGLKWMSLLRLSTRGLTYVRLGILGRLLTPVQFGHFGIATILLSLLETLTETGINIILIQQKKDLKEYLDSAWVVSIVRGLVISSLILLSAPLLADFFNAPDALIVLQLTAVIPFIRGFINPAIVSYQKDLKFYNEFRLRAGLFIIEVICSILAGVITRSAVSFTIGLIAAALVEVFLSYWLFSIRPKFLIDKTRILQIIKSGGWVTLNGILSYFSENGDNITVGRILGSSPLGIYQVAYKLSTLPISEVTNVVNQVTFPIYTKFSEDKERLRKAFSKVMATTVFSSLIFGALIYLFADVLVRVLMGDQWMSAVPIIKVLSIYGIIRTILGAFIPLFYSVEKQKLVAQITFARLLGLLLFIIPFTVAYGLIGAGIAMLISVFFEIPILLFYARKVLW